GGPAVAPLRKLLDDTDPEVRVEAVQALARIGDAASVGEIVKMMKTDPNEGVRFVVIEALGDFGAEGAPAVGALIDVLSNRDWEVVTSAKRSLGYIGKPAVGPLGKALEDSSRPVEVRQHILAALADIARLKGPEEAREAVPVLIRVLQERRLRACAL